MRLIDADAIAIDLHEWQMEAASRGFLNDYEVLDKVLSGLDDPRYTVDPVRHGHWVGGKGEMECSACGELALFDEANCQYITPYCPFCGATMNGGNDNETD